MVCDVVFDSRVALDIVDDLLDNIPSNLEITHRPERIIIVPDRLSKQHLISYICQKDCERSLNDLLIITSEDLAALITSRSRLVDDELLRLIVTTSLLNIDHPISIKLQRVLEDAETPQDSPIIEPLLRELNEYAEFVMGCGYSSSDIISKINCDSDIITKRTSEVLEFFDMLLNACEALLSDIEIKDQYLTRAHLVADAIFKLEGSALAELLDILRIKKIYVIGVPVFDNTLLSFILKLMVYTEQIIIGLPLKIAERTKKRMRAMSDDLELSFHFLERPEQEQTVEYYSLPDKRREVELTAVITTDLLLKGKSPNEILILSRLASDYQPYFRSIFTDFGIPAFMRVREALAFSPVYRLIESVIMLLIKAESNMEISAEDISRPLRLGFPLQRGFLEDRRFLAIETELEALEKYNHRATIDGWLDRFEQQKAKVSDKQFYFLYYPPEFLLEWIDNNYSTPNVRKLIKLIYDFIDVYGVEKNYPLLEMISTSRLDLSEEHISSQANRVLNGLRAIVRYYRRISEVRLRLTRQKSGESWSDILRAYRGVVGGITYGHIHRDSDSLLFTDVGLSHFIDTDYRIILGMTNDQFPRKYSDPFLITSEMREILNYPDCGFFISSSSTQEEIERYLYDVAFSRSSHIILAMNYLDARGHKQNWSIFVDVKSPESIYAYELRVELSSSFKDHRTTSNVSTVLHDLFRTTRYNNIEDIVSNLDTVALKLPKKWQKEIESITASVVAMKTRVIGRIWDLHLELGPKDYVSQVIDKDRIPHAWELDLLIYCPTMYHFYVFYNLLPYKRWIEKQEGISNPLEYVPAYKYSFMGELPPPVWRLYFSTRAINWLIKQFGTNTASLDDNLLEELTSIINKLHVSIAEKSSLKRLAYILADHKNGFSLKPPSKSSQFSNKILRPLAISVKGHGSRIIPLKFSPKKPFLSTILKHKFYDVVACGSTTRYYVCFSSDPYKIDFNTALKMLHETTVFSEMARSAVVREQVSKENICSDCPYRTLCGYWGF